MSCMESGFAEVSTEELVRVAEAVAAELAVRAAPDSGTTAMEWAEALGRCIDLAEAALAVLVRQVDASDAHRECGFPSTVAWLRERLGMRHGRASERLTLARQLPRLPRVAKLLAVGGLSVGFASAISAAVPRLDDADTAAAEDILLGMVQDGCTVQQVGKAGDRITDLIRQRDCTDGEPPESRRGFSRSWLQSARSLDGGAWLKGWLTPEHAAAFEEIIAPLAKPRVQGDDRDLGQRTADAMMSVITEGNKGAGVTVIIDLAAYTAATGDTGPFTHTSRTTSHHPGHTGGDTTTPGQNTSARSQNTPTRDESRPRYESEPEAQDCGQDAPQRHDREQGRDRTQAAETARTGRAGAGADVGADACAVADAAAGPGGRAGADAGARADVGARAGRLAARLLDGTPIPARDARRIALNGGINALVLGGDGLPLYLGRTVRFATPAQRKALLAMYETCVVRGCQIPSHLCEIHHLNGGWKLGTPTDLHQLVPACGWHNRWFEDHQHQLEQTRDARGRTVMTIRSLWLGRTSS